MEAAQGAVSFASRGTVTTQHVWLALREAELHASLTTDTALTPTVQTAGECFRLRRCPRGRKRTTVVGALNSRAKSSPRGGDSHEDLRFGYLSQYGTSRHRGLICLEGG